MISRLREWVYRQKLVKPVELPAFTLSVGNISMGGTGKSAFVMLLAEWAQQRKLPALLLSRGYKRKTSALRVLAPFEALPDASEIGDEPWMIKRRVPGLSLLVHAARARMAKRHWKELGDPRLVLLDDAFQHWRCARDRDVLMIDATESLDQREIPFGRLRETVLAARRADLIVITHASAVSAEALARLKGRLRDASIPRVNPVWKRATAATARIIAADYALNGFLDAASGQNIAELSPEREYLLVSGIAKPDHLRAVVKQAGLKVKEELYFPDHHRLSDADEKQIHAAVAGLRNGCLLTTEKDWGRWRSLFEQGIPGAVICVRFAFLDDGGEELRLFLEDVSRGAGCSISP